MSLLATELGSRVHGARNIGGWHIMRAGPSDLLALRFSPMAGVRMKTMSTHASDGWLMPLRG